MSKFHERLKKLRIENKLSQRQLAPLIGFTQTAISDWENGFNEPTTKVLIACAKFFDVTTDYLLGLENEDGSKNIL